MHFRVFLREMYGLRIFLGVAKISNIFGVLDIPNIFWGNQDNFSYL